MTTAFTPRATMDVSNVKTLASDPSRFDEPLTEGGWNRVVSTANARREVSATLSSIVGGSRRIEMHHNDEGRWSMCIAKDTLATTIVMHWSSYTVTSIGTRRDITRGEALTFMIHEAMHTLYTDETEVPPWIQQRAHIEPLHKMMNFAEDVRIEDIGENVVPAFANMRQKENDRLVAPNVNTWSYHDIVRKVCLVLFSERSCTNGAAGYRNVLAMDTEVARLVDECRQSFYDATYAKDTASVVDHLRPMYETLAPYLPDDNGGTGGNCDDDETGEPGEGEDTGTPVDVTETDETGDGDSPASDEDTDETDDENEGGSASGGDAPDTDEDEDSDADSDDDEDDGEDNDRDTISDPDWTGETFVPNAPRGDWDNLTPRDEDNIPEDHDYINEAIEGEPVSAHWSEDNDRSLSRAEQETSNLRVRVVKTLRRVLQDNANGGWSTRKKSGTFDPRQATRLSLGDMRTFRKKRGAKGSLDYSLVLCLDASASVAGVCGQQIARAGLSVYEAAAKIPGLDVAVCAYGSGLHVALPFDATLRDVAKDGSRNRNRLSALIESCESGVGGSTAEDYAITWAIATSRRRSAESQMIVVLTDGAPNNRYAMPALIEGARNLGIRTGGIGVLHDAPTYHEYATSVTTLDELPSALGSLITTMMKGRK